MKSSKFLQLHYRAAKEYHSLSRRLCQLIFAISFTITQLGSYQNSQAQVEWEEINIPIANNFYSLAVSDNGTIFLGDSKTGGTGGVIYSDDNGQNWVHTGLEDNHVICLTFNSSGNLLAGVGNYNGIQLFDNDKQEWEWVLHSSGGVISIETGYDSLIFAGSSKINISNDDGYTWQETVDVQNDNPLDFAVLSEDTVFLATTNFLGGGGVFRSIDRGISWQNIGLENHFVASLCLTSEGDLYAGCIGQYYYGWGGLYRLQAGSDIWDTLFYWPRVRSMVITKENHIYCGTWLETEAIGGVIHSEDMGENWIIDTAGMGIVGIPRLFLDDNEILYALAGESSKRLYRSALPVSVENTNYISKIIKQISYCSPNPFSTNTTLFFNSDKENSEQLKIDIYSIQSKHVTQRYLTPDEIINQRLFLERNFLNPGIYIYVISGLRYHSTGKFLITN